MVTSSASRVGANSQTILRRVRLRNAVDVFRSDLNRGSLRRSPGATRHVTSVAERVDARQQVKVTKHLRIGGCPWKSIKTAPFDPL